MRDFALLRLSSLLRCISDVVEQSLLLCRYDVKAHRRRRFEMPDELATQRVSLADFLQWQAVLAQLEVIESALDLTGVSERAVDQLTFKRAVAASLGVTLAPTILDVLFAVLDQDGDGRLSRPELRVVAAGAGSAAERPPVSSCVSACMHG